MNINLMAAAIAAVGFGWSYYRFFKGTGLLIGVALELVIGLGVLSYPSVGTWVAVGFVILAFVAEVRHQRHRKNYLSARMTFEGGGIRRGLTPVQVGMLFERPDEEILQLGLVEALGNGLIGLKDGEKFGFQLAEHLQVGDEIINPAERREARKEAGRQAFQVISANDDILLETIRQHEKRPLGELKPSIWLEKTAEETEFAMTGFDQDETLSYYDAWISHRLMGVAGDHFEAEEYLGWMVLADQVGILDNEAIAAVAGKIRPDWLPEGENLGAWLKRLGKAI